MIDAKDSSFASGSPKAAPKTLRGKLDKGLDEGFTRLGTWGERAFYPPLPSIKLSQQHKRGRNGMQWAAETAVIQAC